MPTTYSPTLRDPAASVTILVDGDPVNQDDLYKEAGVSSPPKITLTYLFDCLSKLTDGTVGILARLAAQTGTPGEALIGVKAYAGTNFTVAAGTLQSWVQTLADEAARTDIATTWTATLTATELKISSIFGRSATVIGASATSATITTATPIVVCPSWNGSGGLLAFTLQDTSGSRNPEITVFFDPTVASHQASFTRQGAAAPFLTIVGKCVATVRWDGTSAYKPLGSSILQQGESMATESISTVP